MSSLPERLEEAEFLGKAERTKEDDSGAAPHAAPPALQPQWDAEREAATVEEHARQLLTELQMKRKQAAVGSAVASAEAGWARCARSALQRAELAEKGAHCAGAAARRLAAAGEREARRAAENAPMLEAALHENRLLKARVRGLTADVGERDRRERSAQAERVQHEAWARPITDAIGKLRAMAVDIQERQKRTSVSLARLETEIGAQLAARDALLEDRSRREVLERQLSDELQRATDHAAELASMIGALQADKLSSDVN